MDYLHKYSVLATDEETAKLSKLFKAETGQETDSPPFLGAVPQPATKLPEHNTLPWATWNVHGEQCMLISFQERIYVIARNSREVRRLEPRPFTFRKRNTSRHQKESSAAITYTYPTVVLCGTLAWRRPIGQVGTPKAWQHYEDERVRTLNYLKDSGPELDTFNVPSIGSSLVFVTSDCLWFGVHFGKGDLHMRLSAARSLLEVTKPGKECPLHYETHPNVDCAQLQPIYLSYPKPFYIKQVSLNIPHSLFGLPVDGIQLIYPDLKRRDARLVFKRRAWAYTTVLAKRTDEHSVLLYNSDKCEIGVASLHNTVYNHEMLRTGNFLCAVDVRACDDGRLEVVRVHRYNVYSTALANRIDYDQLLWNEPLNSITDVIYNLAATQPT